MTVTTEHNSDEEQQGAELAPKRRVMGREEFRRLLAEDQAQEQWLLSSALERMRAEIDGSLKPPARQQVELERLLAEPEVSERDLRHRAIALESMRAEIEGSLKLPARQQAELERLINAPIGPKFSPEELQHLMTTGTAFGLSPEERQRLLSPAFTDVGLHLSSAELQRLILDGTTSGQALTSMALVQEQIRASVEPIMQLGEQARSMALRSATEIGEVGRLHAVNSTRAMLDALALVGSTRAMLDTLEAVGSTRAMLDTLEAVGRLGLGDLEAEDQWLISVPERQPIIRGHITLPGQPGGATVAPPQPEEHSLPAIDVVQLAGQWTEVLTLALTTGEATVKEVIEWTLAAAENRPGQRPAPWREIEALAKAYKQRGHHYADLGAFARAMGYGRATAHRYLKFYQLTTGEQVLVGRGKRKRGSM